jgi:hypothetical protein
MELKEHVKELVRWAVNKGHTEEEVVDLVYKSFGRRNAAEVARNLGVGDYKALLNRTREENPNLKETGLRGFLQWFLAKRLITVIIIVVASVIAISLVRPLPVRNEWTWISSWTYQGTPGREISIMFKDSGYIFTPTRWNIKSTFWLLRRKHSSYAALKIVAYTSMFSPAIAIAEYLDGREMRFEIRR